MSSPVTKENESLIATAARPDEAAGRAQPVALEVPVSVNGARTVDGSDKREPFSESTKTVLVFGNGAVIRLTSSVAPGQLLFLTNEKTKKEVVCQVVKSKNYRNVSGYVELEFTEPVVGFWGIRFPTDNKPASAPSASTAPSAPQPVAVKPAAPAQTPVATKPPAPVIPIAPKPESVISSTALNSSSPNSSNLSLPRVSDLKSTNAAPKPSAPVVPSGVGSTSSPRASEVQSPVPPATKIPSVPAAPDDSMEALKLHTARLQEELSGLQFAGSNSPKNASPAPTAVPEKSARVLEMAKADVAPAPTKSLLESDDEVKIPSWLEPLARNAAAPASTQDLIEREKAKHAAALTSKPEVEELAADPAPATVAAAEVVAEVPVPAFSGSFLVEENSSSSREAGSSGGSNKGMLIGAIAAGVIILAGGGYWFSTRKPSSTSGTATAATAPLAATSSNSNSLQSQPQGLSASQPNSVAATSPATSPVSNSSPAASNSAPAANLVNTNIKTEVARSAPPAQPPSQPQSQSQSKKASLGQVHLAAPTVTRSTVAAEAPNLEGPSSLSAGEPLSSGIPSVTAKQPSAPSPSAPLAVGGDVKPARQISTVPPVYPSLAKSQHVSGDVKLDALIDATGRVTTMKVISGNTLLHQAAMDALRQWKYQPATLDGKPVPMHLTVTIQFRMQQ